MTVVSGTSNSSLKKTGFFGVSVSSNLKAEFSSSQIDKKFQFRKDSVTVKFSHVTCFWNGNRSGCFNPVLEEYVEISSDVGITFNQEPKMKALKIAEKAKKAILSCKFDQIRVNIPNGDMVGHTGDIAATKMACKVTDEAVKVFSTSALSDAPLVSPSTYCMFLINFPCTAKYDLYSKSKVRIDVEEVKPYHLSLIEKYFSAKLNW
ncbi:hypothetical protein ACOSP7_010883 [Xanthoceras sorbifolium]